jgi:hypothetical protein
VFLHVFVKHEAFDVQGELLPNDGRYQPGIQAKKDTSKAVNVKDDDPAIVYSSDGEDEGIDYQDDKEASVKKVHTHRFTIDFVARYPDDEDDLILHWGLSRNKIGAWGSPDQAFWPENTTKWPDGLAAQSIFKREQENRSIRTTTFVVKWIEEVEPSVNSICFVLTEKNKNVWHSINGCDQRIIMCPQPEEEGADSGEWEGLPKGGIGEVVA